MSPIRSLSRVRAAVHMAGALTLTFAIAVSAAAHAEQGAQNTSMPPMFEAADANGDGVVSLREVQDFAEARIKALDADGDGEIAMTEARAQMMQQRQAHRSSRFAQMDTDGDGTISQEEFRNAAPGRMAMRQGGMRGKGMMGLFHRFDANRDGAVQRIELTSGLEGMFARLDADGDGRLTRGEVRQQMQARRMHRQSMMQGMGPGMGQGRMMQGGQGMMPQSGMMQGRGMMGGQGMMPQGGMMQGRGMMHGGGHMMQGGQWGACPWCGAAPQQ